MIEISSCWAVETIDTTETRSIQLLFLKTVLENTMNTHFLVLRELIFFL